MPCAVGVNELAVLSHAASSPKAERWLPTDFAGRKFNHGRKNIRFRIGIHPGPWRLVAEMRLGEVALATYIEQILDAVKIEKEGVAASAGEEGVRARLDDIRRRAEGDLGITDDFCPDCLGRTRLIALRDEYAYGLPAILGRCEDITESDIGEAIAVVIDVSR